MVRHWDACASKIWWISGAEFQIPEGFGLPGMVGQEKAERGFEAQK